MASELPTKRAKTSPPAIGTHNGHFHADEALAVYLLRLLPTYSNSPVLRTRDPAVLANCHTVVDVGGVYDDSARRYDHHQRGFTVTFPGRTATPLSSAGLVWLHYGHDVIAQRTGLVRDHETTGLLWNKLYTDFVEAVDANDNGVTPYDAEAGTAKFKTHGVTLASLVSDLNLEMGWTDVPGVADHEKAEPNVPVAEGANEAQAAEDAQFHRASNLMGSSFMRKLHGLFRVWVPARATVAQAFEVRRLLDSKGRLMELPGGGVPWKEHLYALEEEEEASSTVAGMAGDGQTQITSTDSSSPNTSSDSSVQKGRVIYVLYPEAPEASSKWRVQAVSVDIDSFVSRRPLPEIWRGLRDEELSKVSGIPGCVFVHASGFIGGNATREGALEMARRSLDMMEQEEKIGT